MADLTTAVEVATRAVYEAERGQYSEPWEEFAPIQKHLWKNHVGPAVIALHEEGMLKDNLTADFEQAVEVAARGRYTQVSLERGYEPWENLDSLSQEPWLTNARLYITALHAAGLLKASDE